MKKGAIGSTIIEFYHLMIKFLHPQYSFPMQSRFIDFFNENNSKKQKKRSMLVNIDLIKIGKDKRTTIMIKNIPNELNHNNLLEELEIVQFVNYFYIPYNDDNTKILGFAFLNVKSYKYIIDILDKIAKYENIRAKGQNKHCEICYANIQGIRALIKTFGKSYLKT